MKKSPWMWFLDTNFLEQKKKAGEWIYKGQRNLSCTIEAESGENVDWLLEVIQMKIWFVVVIPTI